MRLKQFRISRFLCPLLACVLLAAPAVRLAAQAEAPPPQQTPIPINEDPNDPLADRKTKLDRQEALIRKQLEERRRRLEAIRLQREQAAQQQNGQADPNNPQSGQPQAIPYPSDGAPPAGLQNPNQLPQPANVAPQLPPGHPGLQPGLQPGQHPAPQAPGRPATPGAGAARAVPATNQVTFYINPATLVMNVGEKIVTHTGLLNPSGIVFDRVEVALQYPANALRPVTIYDANIRPLLMGEPETALDAARGTFSYRGELTSATQARSVPLVTIEWEAIAPLSRGQITTSYDASLSGAYRGERFVSAGGLGESQLGANLRIEQNQGAMPQGLLMLQDLQAQPVAFSSDESPAPPRLWIEQPAEGEFQPGQWVVIDIGIDNPRHVPFDEVRLAARYDPEAVELVDTDRDNLIDRGRNVLDGPFRSLWPWEMLYVNRIEQERGLFYYRMASMDTVSMDQSSAPLIRVFARIKQPVSAPLLRWIWNPGASIEWPQTGVYRMNENLFAGAGARAAESGPAFGLQRKLPVAGGVIALESYEKANARDYQF